MVAQVGQTLIVDAGVAVRLGENDIFAATTDGLGAGPTKEHLGLRVPVGDGPGLVDLDIGIVGRFKSGAESFLGMAERILCRSEVSRADAEKPDHEQRGQCGQDGQAVFVGQRDEGGGEAEADGGLTRNDGRSDPGGDLRPWIAFGDREVVPRR